MLTPIRVAETLETIRKSLQNANDYLENSQSAPGEESQYYLWFIGDYIEDAFRTLLVLLDSLELSRSYNEVYSLFTEARKDFGEINTGPEGPYLTWSAPLYRYLDAVAVTHGTPSSIAITKDLAGILRESNYFVGAASLFSTPPQSEAQLHDRIEGVLRCLFRDLQHKPRLTKPIKNFEPDTGLPSISTLIEYKYLARSGDVGPMADQVLADTRGYHSPEWNNFIYVIYETRRFRSEEEWNRLLAASGVTDNTQIVVLLGEPSDKAASNEGAAPDANRAMRGRRR